MEFSKYPYLAIPNPNKKPEEVDIDQSPLCHPLGHPVCEHIEVFLGDKYSISRGQH